MKCLMLSKLCETPVSAEQDFNCQVFYDPCRASPGCIPTGSLPEGVQGLCATNPIHPQRTFVFCSKIAGLQCSLVENLSDETHSLRSGLVPPSNWQMAQWLNLLNRPSLSCEYKGTNRM